MRLAAFFASVAGLIATSLSAGAPATSLRPPATLFDARGAALEEVVFVSSDASASGFDQWKQEFRAQAVSRGVQGPLYDQVMRGVTFDQIGRAHV